MKLLVDLFKIHQDTCPLQMPISVTMINSTNRCYLIFEENNNTPKYAVKMMSYDKIQSLYTTSLALFQSIPSLIPEPLCMGQYKEQGYSIERASSGTNVSRLIKQLNHSEQHEFRLKAQHALAVFSSSVAKHSPWCQAFHLQQQLQQAWQRFQQNNPFINQDKVIKANTILALPINKTPMTGQNQHGDFCLNNLLFDGPKTHIIDFEEFGDNSIPFYDEFSLAISFYNKLRSADHRQWIKEINFFTADKRQKLGLQSHQLSKLLLLTLLHKINQNEKVTKRTQYNRYLLDLLTIFLDNHHSFFPNNVTTKTISLEYR